jgi:hypothetical protein
MNQIKVGSSGFPKGKKGNYGFFKKRSLRHGGKPGLSLKCLKLKSSFFNVQRNSLRVPKISKI